MLKDKTNQMNHHFNNKENITKSLKNYSKNAEIKKTGKLTTSEKKNVKKVNLPNETKDVNESVLESLVKSKNELLSKLNNLPNIKNEEEAILTELRKFKEFLNLIQLESKEEGSFQEGEEKKNAKIVILEKDLFDEKLKNVKLELELETCTENAEILRSSLVDALDENKQLHEIMVDCKENLIKSEKILTSFEKLKNDKDNQMIFEKITKGMEDLDEENLINLTFLSEDEKVKNFTSIQ
ncbi:hypothetical protein HK099_004161 [Clydaea vesicula]|uniref:Uncharacterized protein n=1 Tax=Clydaea vesicula TaxID=447962 RepID=A0AAD5XVT2_9FUNG|nr:hypothetical protein HK099_004161 [Clydaea vesicula]